MKAPESLTSSIEDARQFSARLEVSDLYEERPALLEDLAPILSLFARARTRQESAISIRSINDKVHDL